MAKKKFWREKLTFEIAIRWTARTLAGHMVMLILALAIGHALSSEGLSNPFEHPLPVQLEFAGMLVILAGMIVGWKWQKIGGLLIIGGMLIFHITAGKFWLNWVFGLFDLAGILFLLSWWMDKKVKNKQYIKTSKPQPPPVGL